MSDAATREFAFSDRDFAFLAATANRLTGIVLGAHKRDLIYGRLVRRLRVLKLNSFAEYCELLGTPEGEAEVGMMVNAITTNLTSFFREKHHFEHLGNVLKGMAKKPAGGKRRLRIWSSASSSGEEPYSIAMTVLGAVSDIAHWDARILATDIDTDMVTRGQAGIYDTRRADGIPPAYANRFVDAGEGDTIVMSDALRRLITFKPLNLLHDWPMKGPFDIVFCRNVVIYFDKPTQARLFDRIADIMAPESWLYIGHSESLFKVTDRFELAGKTVYRRVR